MIKVQREGFDVGREIAALSDGNHTVGGLAVFIGLVRDMAGDQPVGAMTLEHYPGMTEKMLARIEAEACERWPLEACQFLIDWLKTKAPFWKLEEGSDGSAWVEARTSDDASAARWDQPTKAGDAGPEAAE